MKPSAKSLYLRQSHSPVVWQEQNKGGPNGPPFLFPVAEGARPAVRRDRVARIGAWECRRNLESKNGRMLVAETGKMAEIARMIAPSLEAMGYDVVRVRLSGGGRPVLQIMAERRDGTDMTVEDCAEISRAVSALLDVEDPIAGAYVLEVSSPGLDRPLTRLDDFVRFAGCEAKLELTEPVDGRKRFRGRLAGLDGDRLRMTTEDGDRLLPVAAIRSARLVLPDTLIADAAKRQNRQ